MKNFKPKGSNVLIELIARNRENTVKKSKSGLWLMDDPSQETHSGMYSHKDYLFVIKEIGPDVTGITVGENVMFTGHYANTVKDDDDNLFVLIAEEHIYASYED